MPGRHHRERQAAQAAQRPTVRLAVPVVPSTIQEPQGQPAVAVVVAVVLARRAQARGAQAAPAPSTTAPMALVPAVVLEAAAQFQALMVQEAMAGLMVAAVVEAGSMSAERPKATVVMEATG